MFILFLKTVSLRFQAVAPLLIAINPACLNCHDWRRLLNMATKASEHPS
jgi:hypothetical protein